MPLSGIQPAQPSISVERPTKAAMKAARAAKVIDQAIKAVQGQSGRFLIAALKLHHQLTYITASC